MTQVVMLCHPVAGDVDGNVRKALRWLAWARRMHPDVAIVAPWVAGILSGEDDADPAQRERGLRDSAAAAARCDGVMLVGGHRTSGMVVELASCLDAGGFVSDLTSLGSEPPDEWDFDRTPLEVGLDAWRTP